MTSDAGALLLGAADKAIGLIERLAACSRDRRRADLVEHLLPTLIGQRVFAIAASGSFTTRGNGVIFQRR